MMLSQTSGRMGYMLYNPDGSHQKEEKYFKGRSKHGKPESLLQAAFPNTESRLRRGLISFFSIKLIPDFDGKYVYAKDYFEGDDELENFEFDVWGKADTVFSADVHLHPTEPRIVFTKDSDRTITTLYIPKNLQYDRNRKGTHALDIYIACAKGRCANIIWPWGDTPHTLGNKKDSADLYYCGKECGKEALPESDGFCGPNDGPQCPNCCIYQYFKEREKYWIDKDENSREEEKKIEKNGQYYEQRIAEQEEKYQAQIEERSRYIDKRSHTAEQKDPRTPTPSPPRTPTPPPETTTNEKCSIM